MTPCAVPQRGSRAEPIDGEGARPGDEGQGAEPGQDELGDGAADRRRSEVPWRSVHRAIIRQWTATVPTIVGWISQW
jgi:hypothetical protein